MKVLEVRNVHEALPKAIMMLKEENIKRDSRNGPVLVAPYPVTTVYANPCERVLFWPDRDANPFFHLYESLWMLAGRNDVAGPVRYAKNMANYSDDGQTFHGAYGHRWRQWFADWSKSINSITGEQARQDQLALIATELKANPESRRCVLQMWDGQYDLGRSGKDLPCNTIATFQRDDKGRLDLTVFCRSNDIIWGAYGANAVHFSMLLEYVAHWIGCPVGVYRQISVNWHAYLDIFSKIENSNYMGSNPYAHSDGVHTVPMSGDGTHERVDELISILLDDADCGFPDSPDGPDPDEHPWARMVYLVLKAHEMYRTLSGDGRYDAALEVLSDGDQKADWIVAATQWMTRHQAMWRRAHESQPA